MKTKKLNCIIPLVIYPFDLMVSFGQNNKELVKILKEKGIRGQEDLWHLTPRGVGRTCIFNNGAIFLRLRNFPETSFDYGVLNHEIFHAVSYFMNKISMPLEIGVSDEAYAYLIGYITKEIFEQIRLVLSSN